MGEHFLPVGAWRGQKLLWMDPESDPELSESNIEVQAREFRYTWAYRGAAHRGVLALSEQEGRAVIDWQDSFHAVSGMRLIGRAEQHQIVVSGHYPDGRGGPDWGWRIEIHRGGPPFLRMVNITPDGEEALAVDLRAFSEVG